MAQWGLEPSTQGFDSSSNVGLVCYIGKCSHNSLEALRVRGQDGVPDKKGALDEGFNELIAPPFMPFIVSMPLLLLVVLIFLCGVFVFSDLWFSGLAIWGACKLPKLRREWKT